jgi:hypothetical protein
MLSLFLDSGAFSVFTKNAVIDINEYVLFIKENINSIDLYASLDVIESAEKTFENYVFMLSKDLNPIVTFHNNEDFKWLKLYLEESKYVALGGFAGRRGDKKAHNYLKECWRIISKYNKDSFIHGFGITSLDLVSQYEWTSVDSTTWVKAAGYGEILIPKEKHNSYLFLDPIRINVSADTKTKKTRFFTYPLYIREYVEDFIKNQGYSVEELSLNIHKRRLFNINYFKLAVPKTVKIFFAGLEVMLSDNDLKYYEVFLKNADVLGSFYNQKRWFPKLKKIKE